jgi:hypothetical protein
MTERRFITKRDEDSFLVGHLEGERYCGVYLSPEYIGRLRQIQHAVMSRMDIPSNPNTPDALMNLIGVIDRLTKVHGEQARAEGAPPTQGDLEAIADAKRELEAARLELEKFRGGPKDPSGNDDT